MRLAPLYQQERDRLQQEARLEGKLEGKLEGRLEGRLEGIGLAKQEIARNMLRKEIAIEEVAEITGLSVGQVTQLRDNPRP